MVPKVLLDSPKFGCINIHASLLPKNRGGAPIHKTIVYGDTETGSSIMKMAVKMDAGAVCSMRSIPIQQEDTMGTLHDKLAVLGANLIIETLPDILSNQAVFVEQQESLVTYASNVTKAVERIAFYKYDWKGGG